MLEKIKSMDKKTILFGVGIIVIIIVCIILFSNLYSSNLNKSVSDIENKLETAAKKYIKSNNSILPTEELETVTVNMTTLINGGYMKNIANNSKYESCSGEVDITKVQTDYLYKAYLKCTDNYMNLKNTIINSGIVNSGDGLYQIDDTYVYRGENVNNYLKIGQGLWRIINIDNNGNIKIIIDSKADSYVWDDRYNSNTGLNTGIVDFNVSRISDSLNEIFNEYSLISSEYVNNIYNNAWCIGFRSDDDSTKNNTKECSLLSEKMPFGFITVSEYMLASLDDGCNTTTSKECMNYNYFIDYSGTWWTLTAEDLSKSKVYYVNKVISKSNASSAKKARVVTVLKNSSLISSGTGTKNNPYVLK